MYQIVSNKAIVITDIKHVSHISHIYIKKEYNFIFINNNFFFLEREISRH